MVSSPAVYILHENPEWFPPLEAAFAAEGVPVREWLLTEGSIDLLAERRMECSGRGSAHPRTRVGTRSRKSTRVRFCDSWKHPVVEWSMVAACSNMR